MLILKWTIVFIRRHSLCVTIFGSPWYKNSLNPKYLYDWKFIYLQKVNNDILSHVIFSCSRVKIKKKKLGINTYLFVYNWNFNLEVSISFLFSTHSKSPSNTPSRSHSSLRVKLGPNSFKFTFWAFLNWYLLRMKKIYLMNSYVNE